MAQPVSLRLGIVATSLLSSLSAVAPAQDAERPANSIASIAIYSDLISRPEMIPFFKACGYNTYQCWDMGWSKPPDQHGAYYAELAEGIRRVQAAGFRVYVLVSTNLNQRRSIDQKDFTLEFDPTDDRLVAERYEYVANAVRQLRGANGFTVCAGDPGGHKNADMAKFVEVTRRILGIFEEEAPAAERAVNLWAVFYWDHFPSPFELAGWERDVEMQREFIAIPDIIGPSVNIEFPLHNYYRSLALDLYTKAGKEPEPMPTAEDVQLLKDRGVKRLWGWPYFLTDECDDGYDSTTAGLTQAETRYLRQIVSTAQQLGLTGLVANSFGTNIFAESLNLYAFARFCQDPALTPDRAIEEFAALVSEPATVADLVQVIRFIENHSTWQKGLPDKFRLPDFEVEGLASAADAKARLAAVQPRSAWPQPVDKTPKDYIAKLEQRLNLLIGEER